MTLINLTLEWKLLMLSLQSFCEVYVFNNRTWYLTHAIYKFSNNVVKKYVWKERVEERGERAQAETGCQAKRAVVSSLADIIKNKTKDIKLNELWTFSNLILHCVWLKNYSTVLIKSLSKLKKQNPFQFKLRILNKTW